MKKNMTSLLVSLGLILISINSFADNNQTYNVNIVNNTMLTGTLSNSVFGPSAQPIEHNIILSPQPPAKLHRGNTAQFSMTRADLDPDSPGILDIAYNFASGSCEDLIVLMPEAYGAPQPLMQQVKQAGRVTCEAKLSSDNQITLTIHKISS